MKRNIRFWGRYSAEGMIMVFCILAAIEGSSLLFGHGFETFASFLSELRMLLLIFATVILFFLNNSAQTLYIPLLLSHGETRKTVFIGHTLTKLAICVITVILLAALALLSGEDGAMRVLPTQMLILLIFSAFGGILGILLVKCKWIGTLIFLLACGGFGMTIGLLFAFSGRAETLIRILQEVAQCFPWWLCAVTAVFVLTDLCCQWAVLRRAAVKL